MRDGLSVLEEVSSCPANMDSRALYLPLPAAEDLRVNL